MISVTRLALRFGSIVAVAVLGWGHGAADAQAPQAGAAANPGFAADAPNFRFGGFFDGLLADTYAAPSH